MKSMVVDHVLGSSDTVWMPWPVRFQIFFKLVFLFLVFKLMGRERVDLRYFLG